MPRATARITRHGTALLASCAGLIAAGCASSTPAPIDYRNGAPEAARVHVEMTASRAARPAATPVIPPPSGGPAAAARPSASPAVQEAAAMAPQTGGRPGGAMRQPRGPAGGQPITVARGDTVYDISQRHSVQMRALIETNGLQPPYALNVGQVLRLPPPNIHTVERGETLYSVSRRYNIDTRSLAVMNGLERPWTVWPGDELVLPALARDQGRSAPSSLPAASTQPSTRPSPSSSTITASAPPPVRSPAPSAAPIPSPAIASTSPAGSGPPGPISLTPGAAARPAASVSSAVAGEFIWPVSGPVLAGFGVSADGTRNDGVNIAVDRGTEVRAAAAGDVVYAGNELAGFGNLVLIRHKDGWVTAYAHADSLTVREGDRVAQGQTIARAGSTGSASRPQVHFELRRGKDPVDPAAHLPR